MGYFHFVKTTIFYTQKIYTDINTRNAIHVYETSNLGNSIQLIETQDKLKELCRHILHQQKKIAVDLEGNSHHYHESISLIQVSILGSDFIIDPLKIDDLSCFLKFWSNLLYKKSYGSDFDVVSLQRDFNIKVKNLFDTQIAAYMLGLEGLGLAALLKHYFAIELEKSLQKHDWSYRPLEQNHLEYARNDTHWLLALHEILINSLQKEQLIEAVLEESEILSNKDFVDRRNEETAFLRVKGSSKIIRRSKKTTVFYLELSRKCAKKETFPLLRFFRFPSGLSLPND